MRLMISMLGRGLLKDEIKSKDCKVVLKKRKKHLRSLRDQRVESFLKKTLGTRLIELEKK